MPWNAPKSVLHFAAPYVPIKSLILPRNCADVEMFVANTISNHSINQAGSNNNNDIPHKNIITPQRLFTLLPC